MTDSTETGLRTITISRAALLEKADRFVGATTTSELEDLKSAENRTVWHQFSDRYRPMIMSFARNQFGFSEADADEAAQATMIAFAEEYQKDKYNRDKGRLRSWLFGIAKMQIKNLIRKQARIRERQEPCDNSGSAFFDQIAYSDDELEKAWEEEWRQAIYRQCIQEVSVHFDKKTIEAFDLFARQGMSAKDVAEKLDMSQNAVFLAKHKILKRIRELVPLMEENW